MGSHFLTLCVCSLENVQAMVGSHDRTVLNRIGSNEREKHAQALTALIDGTFEKDDSTQADNLIRAMELLCKSISAHSVTIEMYDDEEEAPLLWRLCWEGDDGIEIPMSENGTPAVTYHSPDSVQSLTKELQKLQRSGGYDEQYLSLESLEDILKALKTAIATKCGIFGFVEY